jgi:hypothetical protein
MSVQLSGSHLLEYKGSASLIAETSVGHNSQVVKHVESSAVYSNFGFVFSCHVYGIFYLIQHMLVIL